jgi:hypothetical protein
MINIYRLGVFPTDLWFSQIWVQLVFDIAIQEKVEIFEQRGRLPANGELLGICYVLSRLWRNNAMPWARATASGLVPHRHWKIRPHGEIPNFQWFIAESSWNRTILRDFPAMRLITGDILEIRQFWTWKILLTHCDVGEDIVPTPPVPLSAPLVISMTMPWIWIIYFQETKWPNPIITWHAMLHDFSSLTVTNQPLSIFIAWSWQGRNKEISAWCSREHSRLVPPSAPVQKLVQYNCLNL